MNQKRTGESGRRLIGLWRREANETTEDFAQRVFDAIQAAVQDDEDETFDEEDPSGCSPEADD